MCDNVVFSYSFTAAIPSEDFLIGTETSSFQTLFSVDSNTFANLYYQCWGIDCNLLIEVPTHPTNTSLVFHVEMTWNDIFDVVSTWNICGMFVGH